MRIPDLSNEEAREVDMRQWVVVSSVATRKNALDAYRTAVRATLLASLIEKVEAMEGDDCDDTGRFNDAVVPPRWIRRADVLTLLRTEAENG